jgi:hypothetical protein
MPNYKTIPDYLVDRRARDLAKQSLQVVCPKLQIKPPSLHWIADDEFGPEWFAQDVAGFCSKDGNEIFIHRDQKLFSIANTVVHEARHVWQIRNPQRYPIPGKTYTRDMNQSQKERDARIFEREFWNGREKQDGSFDDIERLLTEMQLESARAELQARSQQYAPKPRIIGLPYASSASYPSQVKMRLIVPSEREMEKIGCSKF